MRLLKLYLVAAIIFTLSACAGNMNNIKKNAVPTSSYLKMEQAQQTVALALEYNEQGGYEKSADLFIEAADLFHGVNAKDDERRSLIAAAKVHLKCSQRHPFLLTIARCRQLIDHLEMPPEDERFLINLADHMKGNPLTYPVNDSWNIVFNDNQ